MEGLLEKNTLAAEVFQSDRRFFLKTGLFFTAALGFWTPELAVAATRAPVTARAIKLANVHTGEKFSGEYWHQGKYLPDAFGQIKKVLRDFRTNEKFPIDPRLMDVLFVLQNRLGNFNSFEVFSGYRSPKTNNMLRNAGEGVARRSLHMQGQAVDVRLPGTRLPYLKSAAQSLKSGGVGYYPSSNFVHIDTGRVRSW